MADVVATEESEFQVRQLDQRGDTCIALFRPGVERNGVLNLSQKLTIRIHQNSALSELGPIACKDI